MFGGIHAPFILMDYTHYCPRGPQVAYTRYVFVVHHYMPVESFPAICTLFPVLALLTCTCYLIYYGYTRYRDDSADCFIDGPPTSPRPASAKMKGAIAAARVYATRGRPTGSNSSTVDRTNAVQLLRATTGKQRGRPNIGEPSIGDVAYDGRTVGSHSPSSAAPAAYRTCTTDNTPTCRTYAHITLEMLDRQKGRREGEGEMAVKRTSRRGTTTTSAGTTDMRAPRTPVRFSGAVLLLLDGVEEGVGHAEVLDLREGKCIRFVVCQSTR